MNKVHILIGLLLFAVSLAAAKGIVDIDLGFSSFVGGYYYQNLEEKDFEYKENHNWYLALRKDLTENIETSAEIRYYPELFDKKLYLYSASAYWHSHSLLDVSWEFDRVGLGGSTKIHKRRLNDIRSDQNFITDYRFNGAVVILNLGDKNRLEMRAGGNNHNTGIASFDYLFNHHSFSTKQSFVVVSRDNRFNAQALNLNNLTSYENNFFFIQNMLHTSFVDYYRKNATEKSNVVKDFIEFKVACSEYIEPQISFYYEAENWDKHKVLEMNSLLNFLINSCTITPGFKWAKQKDYLQREYSLLVEYQLQEKWSIGFLTEFIDTPTNQDIISYGIQTKFNLPVNNLFN